MKNITIKLILDKKTLLSGDHTVYLRIIKNRKKKVISLGLQCEREHFVNQEFTKHHPNYQLENEILLNLKRRALRIIREFQVNQQEFTLNEFENVFRGIDRNHKLKVLDFFNEIIDEMTRAGRLSSALAYKDTRNSLIKFQGKNFRFKNITPAFLEKYEVFLREKGCINGSIAFRMRQLRSIFNKARIRKVIPREPYPFEEYKISKLKTVSNKIALTLEEFKKFHKLDLSSKPHLLEAYHYFMFSLFTRGMNFHDMMFLKWSDIRDGRIYYTRSKTKGKFNLEIIPPVQAILDYFHTQKRPTQYVFPILLQESLSPQQISHRKHKVLSRYNKRLKEIAQLAGINKNLTSYVARHSFATILKMRGTSIEKISEMMGHSNVITTMNYLNEFSNEELDKENRKLLGI